MKVRGATPEQLEQAAKLAGGMVIYRQSHDPSRFVLRPGGADKEKWRATSVSAFNRGRRVHAICFHGHREFFRHLFKLAPGAVVTTKLAKWTAENFEQGWPALAKRNVGPPIAPLAAEDACNCGTEVQFSEGVLENGVLKETNIRRIRHSAIRACPFTILVPSHYRDDGSCKCNDADERKRMIEEWDYTPADFKDIPLQEAGK